MELKIGSPAPEFCLADDSGNERSLADFAGKKLVIFFYAKDNTAGCTCQVQGYGELYGGFRQLGYEVVGVSRDSAASHLRFKEKLSLPYALLSDPEKTAHEAYGVWKEKTMYGKKSMGTERSSFVIDENGRLLGIFRKVNAKANPGEMLAFCAQQQKGL
ncbi:MAG: peroxiredoxin [Clostridiales bacterium]|nr:peroxiredoxin [Clostridiales bacterium]